MKIKKFHKSNRQFQQFYLSSFVSLILLTNVLPIDGQGIGVPPSRSLTFGERNTRTHLQHEQRFANHHHNSQTSQNGGINLADSFLLNRIRQGDSDALTRLNELRQTADTPISVLHNFFQAFNRPNSMQRTGLFSLLRNLAVAQGFLPNSLAFDDMESSNFPQTETPARVPNNDLISTGGTDIPTPPIINNGNMQNVDVNNRISSIPVRVSDGQIIRNNRNRSIAPNSLEIIDSRELDVLPVSTPILDRNPQRFEPQRVADGIAKTDVVETEKQPNIAVPNIAEKTMNNNVIHVNVNVNTENGNVPSHDMVLDLEHSTNTGTIPVTHDHTINNDRETTTIIIQNVNAHSVDNLTKQRPGVLTPFVVSNPRTVPPVVSSNHLATEHNSENSSVRSEMHESRLVQTNDLSQLQTRLNIDNRRIGTFREVNTIARTENINIGRPQNPETPKQSFTPLNISTIVNQWLPNSIRSLNNSNSASISEGNSIIIGRNIVLDPRIENMNIGRVRVNRGERFDIRRFTINGRTSSVNTGTTSTINTVPDLEFGVISRNEVSNSNSVNSQENLNSRNVFTTRRSGSGGLFTSPPLERRRGFLREGPDQATVRKFSFTIIDGHTKVNETSRKNVTTDVAVNRTTSESEPNLERFTGVIQNVTETPSATSTGMLTSTIPQDLIINPVLGLDKTLLNNPSNSNSIEPTTAFIALFGKIPGVTDAPRTTVKMIRNIGTSVRNSPLVTTLNSESSPMTVARGFTDSRSDFPARNSNVASMTDPEIKSFTRNIAMTGRGVTEATTKLLTTTRDYILQQVGHIELEPTDHVFQFVGDMNLTLAEPEFNVQIVGDLNFDGRRQFMMEVAINGSSRTNKALMQRIGNTNVSSERIRVHGTGDVRLVTKERVIIERIGFVKFHRDPLKELDSQTNTEQVQSVFRIESLDHSLTQTDILFLGNETNVQINDKRNETILQLVGSILPDVPHTKTKMPVKRNTSPDAFFGSDSSGFNTTTSDIANLTDRTSQQTRGLDIFKTFTPEELPLHLKSPMSELEMNASVMPTPDLSEFISKSPKRSAVRQNDNKSLLSIILKPIGRIFSTVETKPGNFK